MRSEAFLASWWRGLRDTFTFSPMAPRTQQSLGGGGGVQRARTRERVRRGRGLASRPRRGSGRALLGGAGAPHAYLVSVGGVGMKRDKDGSAVLPALTSPVSPTCSTPTPDKPPEGSRARLPGLTGPSMGLSHLTDHCPAHPAANGATQPSPRSGGRASSACSRPLSPGPWGSPLLAQEAPVCWSNWSSPGCGSEGLLDLLRALAGPGGSCLPGSSGSGLDR